MAAAPANAAAALVLLTNTSGKLAELAFDLGQLVGATNDANCFLFTQDKNGDGHSVLFVSAATASASAGVLTIARAMAAIGIAVYRYVCSTTEIQYFNGPDATGVFTQYAVTPTDVEWIDGIRAMMAQTPHA